MQIITHALVEYADIVLTEINNNKHIEHYIPYAKDHKIFEQARMKFLNRNLNYFYFPNMVAQTVEGNEFNPAFKNTVDFCNLLRVFRNNTGPFGRMCVWELEPGKSILPHVDNFMYHRHIIRNIFCVTGNNGGNVQIKINSDSVNFRKGTYFQFFPATEYHSFINESNESFYFLGVDFWVPELLDKALQLIDVEKIINDPTRLSTFGAQKTTSKYMSQH
jgi:mannose-6-phosphate isomerase-like protein (cupin superfamily)